MNCLLTNTADIIGHWLLGMVCTVLCLCRRVCVCVCVCGCVCTDIHEPALCYNTQTHTLQLYDTLHNSLALLTTESDKAQSITGVVQSLENLYARSQIFSKHIPTPFPELLQQLTCWEPRYFKFYSRRGNDFSDHTLEFSLIPVPVIPFFMILWHTRSKQSHHFSTDFTFPKCCCYFQPSSTYIYIKKNIQYCVNKESK